MRFVDVQERGPFGSFRHEHRFEPKPVGTLMIDELTFAAPPGWLGVPMEGVLARYLTNLVQERNALLRRIAEGD
jgi:ligand-binding SRPBCC domain-containing protein